MPTPSTAKRQSLQHGGHLLWEYSFYVRRELGNPIIYLTSAVIRKTPRMVMARNIALHHHQTFNGKGYPRLKSNNTIQAPIFKDYAEYQNHAPLSGSEIPTEALIVGLADRYDALRSTRPYKEAYSHEKTLAVLDKDDRSGINGCDWYSFEIWGVFETHHSRFKDVFEHMQN